eukprot:2372644-Prymnesium_polylepis.1
MSRTYVIRAVHPSKLPRAPARRLAMLRVALFWPLLIVRLACSASPSPPVTPTCTAWHCVLSFVGHYTASSSLNGPVGIAHHASRQIVVVAVWGRQRVSIIDAGDAANMREL